MLLAYVATISLALATISAETTSLGYDSTGNQRSQQPVGDAPPGVLRLPTSQVVPPGVTTGFSVNISSPLPVTYQWFFNGNAISGATGDSLLLRNISTANEGTYTVVVTNTSGSVSSTYRLGVDLNGNGLPDSWELAYFGNLNQSPSADFDGDGISNLDEFFNGTDPTVRETYYWNVASGDFNVPSNWIRYNTPGIAPRAPGAGDRAVIDSGAFTLPANTRIDVAQVTVNVAFAAPAASNFNLYISGNWTFAGPVTLANNREFIVSGGGRATISGSITLNGGSLSVWDGSQLSLPSVTSYAVPAGSNVQWLVERNGGLLSFPNLTTITGPASPNSYLTLLARFGTSTLSLPALTTITKPADGDNSENSGVQIEANNGATVTAPLLSAFNDNDSRPDSRLRAYDTSVIDAPLLTAPKGVNIDLNAASHPERFASLQGARYLSINGGSVTMSNLTTITGLSSISAYANGAQLTLPNVTSYTVPAGLSVTWAAERNGSVLNFPNLTTITGPASPNTYLTLLARFGTSTVSLPALTTITKPDDTDSSENSGVRLEAYDGATVSAPLLSAFNDNDSHPDSRLRAFDASVIDTPLLVAPKGVSIDLNAASHPERLTSLEKARYLWLNTGTVVMSNLSTITGLSSIYAYNNSGTQLSFPNVTSYAVPSGMSVTWGAERNGSLLSFPNLQTMTGPSSPNTYFTLVGRFGSSTLSLPALTTITKPDDGDIFENSGVQIEANDGATVSAPLLSAFNDNDSHPGSRLRAVDLSVISAPLLLAPKGVNIDLNAASHPERFASLTGARYLYINRGAVTMGSLSTIAGLSSIYAYGGGQLSLPNVTSYAVPAGMNVTWSAENNGSSLVFPNLATITGPSTPNSYLTLQARFSSTATLSLPVLTTITKPNDGDVFTNSGVRMEVYDGATIAAPLLSAFNDNDTNPNSLMRLSGSGSTFIVPQLTLGGIHGVTLIGLTLPAAPSPTPLTKAVSVSGATFRLTIYGTAGRTYQLQQSGTLPFAIWQNVGSPQNGTNALLELTAPVSGGESFFRAKVTSP